MVRRDKDQTISQPDDSVITEDAATATTRRIRVTGRDFNVTEARHYHVNGQLHPHAETLVKSNALRRVYRVEFDGKLYFRKEHCDRRVVGRIKRWLAGDPARSELEASRYALQNGVPAVRIFESGRSTEHTGQTISYHVAVGLADVRTLADVFDDARAIESPRERGAQVNAIIASAARLLATAHDAAFLHRDSHPGNVLVRTDRDTEHTCQYVDLYGARCGKALTDREVARNLASIHQWFSLRATRTQRLRGLREYIAAKKGGMSAGESKRWARNIELATQDHAQMLYRKRDRRIGRANAFFARHVHAAGWRAVFTLRRRNHPRLGRSHAERVSVESCQSSLDAMVGSHGSDIKTDACTELFFAQLWADAITWRVLGSRAWRRYKTSLLAMHRDLPCSVGDMYAAHVDGAGIDCELWRRQPGNDCVPLSRWLEQPMSPAARRRTIENAGRLLAQTMQRGLVISNLTADRLLVTESPHDPVVSWDCIEGTALRRSVPRHACMWMLASLARTVMENQRISSADAGRFLRALCRRQGLVKRGTDWRLLWADVDGVIRHQR